MAGTKWSAFPALAIGDLDFSLNPYTAIVQNGINYQIPLNALLGNVSVGTQILNTSSTTALPTITWDIALGNIAYLTLQGNYTMYRALSSSIPTGVIYGTCILVVKQDGTGGRTLTWDTGQNWYWPGGVAPVVSSAANAIDVITFTFEYGGGNNAFYGAYQNDYKRTP